MFSSSGGVSRVLVTQTLSNTPWVAPATTTRIEAASGKGQDGSPAFDSQVSGYNDTTTSYYYTAATGQTAILGQSTTFYESTFVPGDYCDVPTTYGNGDQFYNCYTRVAATGVHHWPADNGADTTFTGPGVSQTFPGGQGKAAVTTNINTPFAVTPGASYQPVIAGGGFLTISYYK